MRTQFQVNGRTVTVDEEDDTPLLWIIRDEIGLKGSKLGRGIGMCGACTVHVGGRPTRSCITPISAVEGAEITTIEGLHPEGNIRCSKSGGISRYLNAATANRADYAGGRPSTGFSLADGCGLRRSDGGNLCRCMTYPRIRTAIKAAAALFAGKVTHE